MLGTTMLFGKSRPYGEEILTQIFKYQDYGEVIQEIRSMGMMEKNRET